MQLPQQLRAGDRSFPNNDYLTTATVRRAESSFILLAFCALCEYGGDFGFNSLCNVLR